MPIECDSTTSVLGDKSEVVNNQFIIYLIPSHLHDNVNSAHLDIVTRVRIRYDG